MIYQHPHPPELQPAKHLWQLSDEPIQKRTFDALDTLGKTLDTRCVALMANPELNASRHALFRS
jgi:hypothetical protein